MDKNLFKDKENINYINWKCLTLLKRYTTRFWNIKPRKYTKIRVKFQKKIRKAIIRARELWLVPYIK